MHINMFVKEYKTFMGAKSGSERRDPDFGLSILE